MYEFFLFSDVKMIYKVFKIFPKPETLPNNYDKFNLAS